MRYELERQPPVGGNYSGRHCRKTAVRVALSLLRAVPTPSLMPSYRMSWLILLRGTL